MRLLKQIVFLILPLLVSAIGSAERLQQTHPQWNATVYGSEVGNPPINDFYLQPQDESDGYFLHTDNVILDIQNRVIIVIDPR